MDKKLELKPITYLDIDCLDKTEYKNLSLKDRKALVLDSEQGDHNGNFFRFFLVQYGQENVGVISMCGHGEKVISVAPEIIMEHRGKGFAFKSLQKAYEIAKNLGFESATAGIRKENIASQNLHIKLGFTYENDYVSKNGNYLKRYSKQL